MGHLLLVDDDSDVAEAFAELLRAEGRQVPTARTSEERPSPAVRVRTRQGASRLMAQAMQFHRTMLDSGQNNTVRGKHPTHWKD
jgi:CheY-like chemotaxis protein